MTPGTLRSHEDIAIHLDGARAWRIRDASKDLGDTTHELTGIVIAPDAPDADRPMVI